MEATECELMDAYGGVKVGGSEEFWLCFFSFGFLCSFLCVLMKIHLRI